MAKAVSKAASKGSELMQEAAQVSMSMLEDMGDDKRKLREAEEGDLEVKGKYVTAQAESMEMEVMMSHGQQLIMYHDDAQEGSLAGFGYR